MKKVVPIMIFLFIFLGVIFKGEAVFGDDIYDLPCCNNPNQKIIGETNQCSLERITHNVDKESKHGDECYSLRVYRKFKMKCTNCGAEREWKLQEAVVHTHPKCRFSGVQYLISDDDWYNGMDTRCELNKDKMEIKVNDTREILCCNLSNQKILKDIRYHTSTPKAEMIDYQNKKYNVRINVNKIYRMKCVNCGTTEDRSLRYCVVNINPECDDFGIEYEAPNEEWVNDPVYHDPSDDIR